MFRCFDELDDAVAILDRDNTVAWLNGPFQELCGIGGEAAQGLETADDLVTRCLLPLLEGGNSAARILEALRSRREISHTVCRARTPDGDLRWLTFSSRMMTGDPYAGMLLARFRDITPEHDEAVQNARDARVQAVSGSISAGTGDRAPYGIWICGPDGAALHASSSLLDLTGATLEEFRRSGWIDLMPLEDAAAVRAEWRRCLEDGRPWDRELKVLDPDGSSRTILSRGVPVRDENGRIVLWAGINLEIGAIQQAERLIAVRAAQQAAIADLGRSALAGAEPERLREAVVRAVAEHLGVECAKVLRHLEDEDAFVLEAAVGFDEALVGVTRVEGGSNSQAGYTLLSREPVIVEDLRTETRFSGPALLRDAGIVSGISVIIQGDGGAYGVLGAHTRVRRVFTRDDINFVRAAANILAQGIERKAIEEALERSEEKFREIAHRSFDMIYTCYSEGGISFISPAVTRILGYAPDELIGRKCRDYVSPVSLSRWEEGQKKMARGEPVEGLEVEFLRKDGTTAFVELNASPIVEHGKVVGVQAAGRDVTERRLNEQLRRRAFEQIERNIEQFAVLGDHIRQPLQVTLGLAEMLDDTKTSAIIRDQVERINEYITQLDRGWVESREVRAFLRRHDLA